MAEIPEHLLRRAAERKAALEAQRAEAAGGGEATDATDATAGPDGEATPADGSPSGPAGDAPEAEAPAAEAPPAEAPTDPSGKIPDALLARSAAAKARKAAAAGGGSDTGGAEGAAPEGGGGAAVATKAPPSAGTAAAARVAGGGASGVVGPAGHTQRLLTVVKAGSIQDVKATPTDKVNVWPHLLVGEFVASLAMTAFLLVFSSFVNAPLLGAANYNLTPNPSKAPWYFLGLQELLTMFHPMVAGVMIPAIGIFGLMTAGYIDKNPSNKPEDRKFAVALFTFFLMFWAVLVIVGSFFRGEGFNFILPWRQGVHEIFDL